MTKRQKVFYRIGQLSGVALIAAWWWLGLLQMTYVGWPRFPQPERGRIVPHEVKGIVVYISPEDANFNRQLKWTLAISGSLVAVCLVLSGELKRITNPPKPPLPPII
jgi:hypothetical protein